QVDTATSGKEALEAAMKTHYHLIFMDHLMPEMDGIATLHEIRRQAGGLNTETPIVALTANAGSEMGALYEREGFDGHLVKPVTGELLEQEALKFLPDNLISSAPELEEDAMNTDVTMDVRRKLHKRPILISTENLCDLPGEILYRHMIKVIPFHIRTQNGSFLDGIEIDTDSVLSYASISGEVPQVIEPEVPDYVAHFAAALEEAQQVIHITPTRNTSGAFPKANAASRSFGNVVVFDSGQMSSGIGLLVLQAAKMAEAGFPLQKILERLAEIRSRTQTTFLLETTTYLKRNGRVPKHATLICEAFMLRPGVRATPQGMRLLRFFSGGKEVARRRYIRFCFREPSQIDTSCLYLAYSGLPMEELYEIEQQVLDLVPFERIVRQPVSSASATMFGPGAFGLIYVYKGAELLPETTLHMPQNPLFARKAAVLPNAGPTVALHGMTGARPIETPGAPQGSSMGRPGESSAAPVPGTWQGTAQNPTSEGLKKGEEYRRLGEADTSTPSGSSALPEWLAENRALSAEEGVKHCGSPEDYLEVLNIFYRTIDEKSDEIERYHRQSDIENYTIKVHALKSSARIIGASELSDMALSLEEAGTAGDTAKINAETEPLLAFYRSYKGILSPLGERE
ncbi:MAG: DegV family EDD domain-containing protein, partial [Lachnospiraceae bacterium]|nr:DegV family EDD domain-containing protein [Lachnospiraceae bacterium]